MHLPKSEPLRWILGIVGVIVLLGIALIGFAFLSENIQTTLIATGMAEAVIKSISKNYKKS